MSTKQLARIAILAAVYVALSILTPIKLINFKFTFEALPVLIGALAFGPIEGGLVALLGTFIYQLFFSGYGLTITTPLWMLPHIISGLLVGYYAKKKKYLLKEKETIFITVVSAVLVTMLNSIAMYLDALFFEYEVTIIPLLPFRFLSGIILAIIYSFLIPQIIKAIKPKK